jgi:hypothetical protein
MVSRCKVCGAFVQARDRFCWSCGGGLAATAPARPWPPAVPELGQQVGLALRRAYLAQQRGSLEEAERLVREALTAEPDSVPALSMLAEILRARGDEVGAVEAAQHATEQAAARGAPPGALKKAREQRADIEEEVVRSLVEQPSAAVRTALGLVKGAGPAWYRSPPFHIAMAALGVAGLFLALVSALGGQIVGCLWLALSLIMAGWCYHDSETHRQPGIFWAPLVLFLGPFGLVIYLLNRP